MRAEMVRRSLACSVLSSLVCAGGVTAQPMFTGLGRLPRPPGPSYTYGLEVSGDGSTAAGYINGAGRWESFLWTSAGGMVGLGFLPQPPGDTYFNSYPNDVSADGSTIVGWGDSIASGNTVTEAFRWTSTGGMVGLGTLPGGGYFSSTASGISADGSTVVGRSSGVSGPEAFRWTSGSGMVGLGDLPGGSFNSTAMAVSADGSTVVGQSSGASGYEAFRWTSDGDMVGLGDLPGGSFSSVATAISADGSTIVGEGSGASGYEAFRWTSSGGMVGLGDLPGGTGSRALDVSADGSTVVGVSYGGEEFTSKPFIWDATHGMRDLVTVLSDLGLGPALNGWWLESANAISDDGLTIVGTGYTGETGYEAFVAVIPEPDGNSLLFAGVLALLGLARWRKARFT